jgi:hypothetical protein
LTLSLDSEDGEKEMAGCAGPERERRLPLKKSFHPERVYFIEFEQIVREERLCRAIISALCQPGSSGRLLHRDDFGVNQAMNSCGGMVVGILCFSFPEAVRESPGDT